MHKAILPLSVQIQCVDDEHQLTVFVTEWLHVNLFMMTYWIASLETSHRTYDVIKYLGE